MSRQHRTGSNVQQIEAADMEIEDNSKLKLDISNEKSESITIGKNSRVELFAEIENDRKLRVAVGEGAEVKMCIIQKKGSFAQYNSIEANATVRTNFIFLGEGKIKVTNALEGDNSKAYDVEVFAIGGSSKLHLDTTLLHVGKNTSGNILVKGIAKDTAVAKVDGMIKIKKFASGANSFLDEHVMLLNPGARADTNPQLEIENNDVSSRHAASVSQIDENKIFYMQARGLERNKARKLIVKGFLSAAIEKMESSGEIKESMERLINNGI